MPDSTSKSVEKVIKKAMPGWRVLQQADAVSPADRARAKAAASKPDAVSPGYRALKAKAAPAGRGAKARKKAKAGKHAQFVTVIPADLPDSAKTYRKVVLVRDKKVVAVQG